MAGRVRTDSARAENGLVQMLKQTNKLTGFIPLLHFLRAEVRRRRADNVDATTTPRVKERGERK